MGWRLAVLLAFGVVACGGAERPPLDPACTGPPETIERALTRAPAPVRLETGTALSDCVALARNNADLQNAGLALTRAADHLAERAVQGDVRSALRLGYLVGATRRGAARTAGFHGELRRRVERAAAFVAEAGPPVRRALARGMRAGRATG